MVSDTPRTLLSKAIKAADRIKKIVFDMRQFFLPAARRELVLPIDLNELADSAIKIVSLQPSMKNMMFNREFVSRPPRVMGDDNQLLQVFTNLFLNAAQASPNGGTISIATSVEPPFIVCRIADNGVGIPQENLARIFDPFFTTKRDWYGTGLGLSVSYTIIKNHSGTISATSTEGKGTTFTIRLPLMRDSVNAPAPVVEEPTGPESRPRILVVDDEDNVRDYLEYLLGESGYLVDSTSDGAVAIRMMEEHHYPVIILDQIMPGLSGLETFRHIQTIDPDCHVILLTGAAEMQAPEVLAEGLYKVLMKPCRGETVLKVVSAGIAGEPAPD